MSYASELAASWRKEIEQLRASLPRWENGNMRMLANNVDVSAEHIAHLKRMIDELERAIPILEGRDT